MPWIKTQTAEAPYPQLLSLNTGAKIRITKNGDVVGITHLTGETMDLLFEGGEKAALEKFMALELITEATPFKID
jgi:hypothetical protein